MDQNTLLLLRSEGKNRQLLTSKTEIRYGCLILDRQQKMISITILVSSLFWPEVLSARQRAEHRDVINDDCKVTDPIDPQVLRTISVLNLRRSSLSTTRLPRICLVTSHAWLLPSYHRPNNQHHDTMLS